MQLRSGNEAKPNAPRARVPIDEMSLERIASKQFETSLKVVTQLKGDEYDEFIEEVKVAAYAAGWHPSILDSTLPPYVSEDDDEGDEGDFGEADAKYALDCKNAFMLVKIKIKGNPNEDVIADVVMGDAREAFKLLDEHFHPRTYGGETAASNDFHHASMKHLGLNVMEWCAEITKRAKLLRRISRSGPAAVPDQMVKRRLLDGLLEEFDNFKIHLERNDEIGLSKTKSEVIAFARDKGISKLTKGGTQKGRANTYTVEDERRGKGDREKKKKPRKPRTMKPWLDCHRFKQGECKYDECIFNHPGVNQPHHAEAKAAFDAASANLLLERTNGTAEADTGNGESPTQVFLATTPKELVDFKVGGYTGDDDIDCDRLSAQLKSVKNTPKTLKSLTSLIKAPTQEEDFRKENDTLREQHAAEMQRRELEHARALQEAVDFQKQRDLEHEQALQSAIDVQVALERERLKDEARRAENAAHAEKKGCDHEHAEEAEKHERPEIPVSVILNPVATNSMASVVLNPVAAGIAELTCMLMASIATVAAMKSKRVVYVFFLALIGLIFAVGAEAISTFPEVMRMDMNVTEVQCACCNGSAVSPSLFSVDYKRGSTTATDYEWCSDSGCNRFVTNDDRDFVPGSIVLNDVVVSVGGGTVVSPKSGTVMVRSAEHNQLIQCENVLFIKECGKKLMPVSTFTRKGCDVRFGQDKVILTDPNNKTLLSGKRIGGLFYFNATTERGLKKTRKLPSAFFGLKPGKITASGQDFARKLFEAHCAYGHMNMDKLRPMLGLKKGTNPPCEACTIANSKKAHLGGKPTNRSTSSLNRTFMDFGFTANTELTFQLFVDDYDRVSHLDILEDGKGSCLSSWTELKGHLENEMYPAKSAFIRTDSEPCYQTPEWKDHCRDENITHEFSSRYRHDQNGVVERAMQVVGIAFRCMMIMGGAPKYEEEHALRFANVVRNHTPTKANNGWTPREKRLGMKLPLNQRLLRGPLFCLVFAHVYEEERSKHAPRGVACVYLGYDDINNTYLVREWKSGQVYYTHDLTFHPTTFPYRTNPGRTAIGALERYDEVAPHLLNPGVRLPLGPDGGPPASRGKSTRVAAYQRPGGVELRAIPDRDVPPEEPAAEVNISELDSDAVSYDPSTSTHILGPNDYNGTDGGSPADWCAPQDADVQVNHTFGDAVEEAVAEALLAHGFGPDPTNMDEARKREDADDWIIAENAEKESFKFHEVYDVVLREVAIASGKRIFGNRPVLKTKVKPPDEYNKKETIEKRKYRLTIQAFTKMLKQGIDYAEKHASTVRWNTIKILIAIAVENDFDITSFDIATFFLYGKLSDEVYMEIPKGWDEDGKAGPEYVWRLKRSVYGLPQAPHCAQQDLWTSLDDSKLFNQSKSDDCVYVTKDSSTGYAASGTHVDDVIVIGDAKGTAKFDAALNAKYKITKTEKPTLFVGVQIERVRAKKWLKLHQGAYTLAVLKVYNMEGARPVDTPMDPGTAKHLMMLDTSSSTPASVKEYQRIVGALMWLMRTRPDMHYCINLLARFLRTATPAHVVIARGRPLRYLMGTTDYGIVFSPGTGKWRLEGSSDSDLAGDLSTAKSTSGVTTQLSAPGGYGNISCRSHLEKKNSTSTLQAETYAFSDLAREITWDRDILEELKFEQKDATTAKCDNDGVLIQSTKMVNHGVAKHFRIAQGFIRDMTKQKVIAPTRVASVDNQSDILTKPLGRLLFEKHRLSIMGPQQPPSG